MNAGGVGGLSTTLLVRMIQFPWLEVLLGCLLAFVCFTLNNEHHSLRIKKNMSYVITLATSHFLWI